MKHALPPLTKAVVEAFVASAIALALRLVCILLTPGAKRRAGRLDTFVARLERRVECIMFLEAVSRFGPGRRKRLRPDPLAPGFRRTRGSLRHFLKSARVRARKAGPIARLARLLGALADSRLYVAHFVRRIARGLHFGRIVACAPRAVAVCAPPAYARVFADSS